MKKIFLLILLPVSLFFSCVGDRIASETMDRAEILLEVNPDSAYILLNEVKTPDRLNERQFARWCMLYCRAADKLFKDMLYTEQLYYNESLLDSARYYLALATGPSLNPYTSIDCFYLGYLIEKEAGDTEKALSLLEQYQAKKDSLYDQQKQVDIIDAEKRHDVVTVVQDNKELVAEKQFLFALAVIICLLLIVGYQLRDRKRRLEINRQQQFLEEEKNRHEKQETEQEGRLRELTAEMERKAAAHEDTSEYKKEITVLRVEKLKQSSLFETMKERCRKVKPDIEQKLNEEEWRSLIRLIDSLFPNVSVFMKENTLGLTKTETKICYLSFLDLHLNEEAVLLGVSSDSANKFRSRTRRKLCPNQKGSDINGCILQKGW